jgi:hypothetical protein
MDSMWRLIKHIYLKHRRHFLTVAFICGFIIDNFTLTRVDQLLDNVILLTYVTLAMGSLLLLYAATAGKFPEKMNTALKQYSPLLTQYAFGGLFSGMLIFYGRSGSWMVSWPFLLVILAVIFGNETIRDRVQRLIFNIAMLFVGLFAYVVLIVPVVLGKMGALVFVGSGVLALLIMLIFIRIVWMVIPRFIELNQRSLFFVIGIIFAGFNFLYFANIIPPIPLSLKDVGVFHSVIRNPSDNSYELTYEKGQWWQFYKKSDDTFHPEKNGYTDDIFCFAKVFAPTSIKTDIYHRWEFFNEETNQWQEHFRMAYAISGGADEGYRGYTSVSSYRDGKWRCTVETGRGQVLGREEFTIDATKMPGEMVTRQE